MSSNPSSLRRRNMWRSLALVISILAAVSGTYAQTPTSSPSPQPSPARSLERQFFENILRGQRAIWTSPFHLHGDDAKWLAPLGLSTAELIATDKRTAGALHDNRLRLNISRDVSYLGSGLGAGTIAGSI